MYKHLAAKCRYALETSSFKTEPWDRACFSLLVVIVLDKHIPSISQDLN